MEDEKNVDSEAVKIEVKTPVEHPAEGAEFANEHGTEVVVYDKDEDGNVVGWHKELRNE